MRSWLWGMGIGLVGVVISSLLVWWLASSDSSFSDRWLTLAMILPMAGVYLGWEGAQKAAAAVPGQNPRMTRISFIIQGALLAALTQYVAFVIASSIWNADRIDPTQAGFLHQLFHPDALPSLSSSSSGGSSSETGWIEMTVLGVVVGTVGAFYVTRKLKEGGKK